MKRPTEPTMIEAYCVTCEQFTPLVIQPMHRGRTAPAPRRGMLICPQCFTLISVLKMDEKTFNQLPAFMDIRALAVVAPTRKILAGHARPTVRRA